MPSSRSSHRARRPRRSGRRFAGVGAAVAAALLVGLVGVVAAPSAWAAIPAAPPQPLALAGNAQVTLFFGPTLDNGGSPITGYAAQSASSNGGVPGSASGSTPSIVVGLLTNGSTYTCTITANNADGPSAPSPASNAVTPIDPTSAPNAPAQPTVGVGNGKLTVSFTAPFNGGATITRYDATCTSSDDGAPGSNSAAGSPITVGGLSNGSTYTCTVTATNSHGTSAPSPASNPAVPSTVPTAPGRPTAGVGNGQLTVSFVAPFDGGNPIIGYIAACAPTTGGAAQSATGPGSPILVDNLTNGIPYTCTVTATNGNGNSAPSVPSAAAVPNRVPDAPAPPTVRARNRGVTVSFVAPFDGGSPITRFNAACASSNGGASGLASGGGSPIVVGGLSNGKVYRCRVSATNANGTGVASLASANVVPSTVPAAPARPSAVAGNARATVSFSAPGTGGSGITGYTAICRSSNGGPTASAAGSRSPLTVTGMANDRTYACSVYARNANGAGPASPASAAIVPVDPVSIRSRAVHGFRLFAGDGGVFAFGADAAYGSAAGVSTHLVVGMAPTFDNRGYWLVATDGGIFSFGDAHFYGSTGAIRLNQPVVGMAPTPTGKGYWLVASDGGIFSYGDAHFYGSTGAIRLNQPIVGMAATPSGRGYWLVASDGGIFSFGDARFHGSAANIARSRIAGMATTTKGGGYWVAAEDGSVYAFGDAPNLGGAPASALRLAVRGIASTASGKGYWLAAGDGGIFAFGDAPYIGWPGPLVLAQTIRGVSR